MNQASRLFGVLVFINMRNNIHHEIEKRNQEYNDYIKSNLVLNNEIKIKSEKYIDSPVSVWPSIDIKWDYRKRSQFLIMDRSTPELFKDDFPHCFCIGEVFFRELDSKIFKFKATEEDGTWGIRNKRKLAYLIEHFSRGLPVSPPLVKPKEGVLLLQSGCHRYALAKALMVMKMPICVEPKYKYEISKEVEMNNRESEDS